MSPFTMLFEEIDGIKFIPYEIAIARPHSDAKINIDYLTRSAYEQDITEINHSIIFIVSGKKSQVIPVAVRNLRPWPTEFRDRKQHSIEGADYIMRLARIAGGIDEYEYLCQACFYAHDLGHIAGGHAGAAALNVFLEQTGSKIRFCHDANIGYILNNIEYWSSKYHGLNLTYALRLFLEIIGTRQKIEMFDGQRSNDLEGLYPLYYWLVKITDRWTYLTHDIEDMLNFKFMKLEDLAKYDVPILSECVKSCLAQNQLRAKDLAKKLFNSIFNRLANHIKSGRINSLNQIIPPKALLIADKELIIPQDLHDDIEGLKDFMYQHYYCCPRNSANKQKFARILNLLLDYLFNCIKGEQKSRIQIFTRGMAYQKEILNNMYLENTPDSILRAIITALTYSGEQYVEAFVKHYII